MCIFFYLLQDVTNQETAERETEETIPPESASTPQSFKQSEPSSISQAPKRRKSLGNNILSGSGVDKAIESLKEIVKQNENKPDDQYDAFGKHISAQLRELPLRSFIILQGKIQDLINHERLAHLPFQQQMHQQVDSRPSTSNSHYSDIGQQRFQQQIHQQFDSRPSTSNSHYSDIGQQPFQQQFDSRPSTSNFDYSDIGQRSLEPQMQQQFESSLSRSDSQCSDLLQQARENALIESDDDYDNI